MVHHAVAKGWSVNYSRFRVVNHELAPSSGSPGLPDKLILESDEVFLKAECEGEDLVPEALAASGLTVGPVEIIKVCYFRP